MTFISASLREAVVERAGNRCEYCHLSQHCQVATFPLDHVQPFWFDRTGKPGLGLPSLDFAFIMPTFELVRTLGNHASPAPPSRSILSDEVESF